MRYIWLLLIIALCGCRDSTDFEEDHVIPQEFRVGDWEVGPREFGRFGYFKDPKTGLCFAYMWQSKEGIRRGGPALAHVPCDKLSPILDKFESQ